jgi:STE24 endopeptidase
MLWLTDQLKQQLLIILLGGPVVALAIFTVHWVGAGFHNYLFGLLFAIQIGAQIIMPTVIMPCFNTFEPLPEGKLKTRIEALAASLGFPLSKLSVMDGSKRSSHSNAFFMGLPGLPKRIVLFDTLLEQASDNEIVAVLAHELGHWKHNHTMMLQGFGLLLTYAQMWAFGHAVFFRPMYTAFGFSDMPVAVGMLVFFTFAFKPLEPMLSFAISAFSRACEFDADAFAAAQGGKDGSSNTKGSAMARHLQTCLVKLSVDNKSAQRAHWLYSAYNFSHPPLPERLGALQDIVRNQAAPDKKTN